MSRLPPDVAPKTAAERQALVHQRRKAVIADLTARNVTLTEAMVEVRKAKTLEAAHRIATEVLARR